VKPLGRLAYGYSSRAGKSVGHEEVGITTTQDQDEDLEVPIYGKRTCKLCGGVIRYDRHGNAVCACGLIHSGGDRIRAKKTYRFERRFITACRR